MKPRGTWTRRQFLSRAAMATFGIAGGLGLYAWRVEPHWVEVTRQPLPLPLLPPGLEGATLVHLSDLHVGPRVDERYVMTVLDRVSDLRPDIVALTGDYISYDGADSHMEALERVLAHLPHGRLATLATLGNHDYGIDWSQPEVADRVAALLAELGGATVLRNQRHDVGGLQIAGLDDLWSLRFEPEAVLPEISPDRPAVVLCHNPDAVDLPGWEGFRGWVLAGHTHGGQFQPPFLPPPILPVENKRYTAGVFDLGGGQMLYINRGLGHLLRVRFNVRPEVTVFSLTKATHT